MHYKKDTNSLMLPKIKDANFWNDKSFQVFIRSDKRLEGIEKYLPDRRNEENFIGQKKINKLFSSYKDNDYGLFFYGLTRLLRPRLIVELGVLQGFSLLTFASALRDNKMGIIEGFDLFEEYPYRHDKYQTVSYRIKKFGLENWAKIYHADAFEVNRRYKEVDFLHVDISNSGDVYRTFFKQWSKKVKMAIILEGGTKERDCVRWMAEYNKPSIVKAVDDLRNDYPDWKIMVIEPFPSLTVAVRCRKT